MPNIITTAVQKLLNKSTPATAKAALGDIIADIYNRLTTPASGRIITASDTLLLSDARTVVRASSSSAVVLTIPNDATAGWTGDAVVTAYQTGTGTASFAAGTGVTLRSPTGPWAAAQYGIIKVMRVGPDEWTKI
jgi:hypothetical protein